MRSLARKHKGGVLRIDLRKSSIWKKPLSLPAARGFVIVEENAMAKIRFESRQKKLHKNEIIIQRPEKLAAFLRGYF